MRVGMGYDVHKLVKDRKLIMGGVEIPYELGLLGHSDADVLLHAIMDALLGAAALGDIGKHFPDTDDRYKGISSIKLLEEVGKKIDEANYIIENIDATIIAQKPKMRPYIDDMRKNIADALKIDVDRVKEDVEEYKADYKELIIRLQELIREATSLSATIQAQESRNKVRVDIKFRQLKDNAKTAKRSVSMANKYYQNMSRVSSEPQFMDQKK